MGKDLEKLREEIDGIDCQIIVLVAKRFGIVAEIAKFKRENGLKVIDQQRKQQVISRWKELARENSLSGELAQDIYELIHDYSAEVQKKI